MSRPICCYRSPHRTVGEIRLIPREKARITIPFLLGEDELPARLVLPDGRRSVLVK